MIKTKLLDKYADARAEMILLLKERGIADESVLKAMSEVERHLFIPLPLRNHAYDDAALPIGEGQTISQPYTVAIMTEELHVKELDKVLEIGTGSGYQTAILAAMGIRVFTIERLPGLLKTAKQVLESLNVRFVSKMSDGTIGWREFSPFDGILVTAGAPEIPKPLIEQLKVGGKLVIPVGSQDFQQMKIVTKVDENNRCEIIDKADFKFVPLIGKEGWHEDDSR
ncbi:MAG: protein-L-isoaspartate(D-aspartate) O-methyltransferase [Bacteroidetes bacterium]|nr:protein-L-isoaspartate(D-aspartate) O-methyltransferase [Bacteroidota bacterium]MCL5034261.1 protein-L-isoaspartate(D-aspartate) O-methyltransferase [Bacteroidota bacterium]